MYVDYTGNSRNAALFLFVIYLKGNGKYLHFDSNSQIADAFKASKQMKSNIYECIDEYERTGKTHLEHSTKFDFFTELELWAGVRECTYTVDVVYQNRYHFKCANIDIRVDIYTVNVTVKDKYDFNAKKDSRFILRFLNFFGLLLEEADCAKEYWWETSYQKTYVDISCSYPCY